MSPSIIFPVLGSIATPPEVKTKPLAMMAWFIRFDGTAGAFLVETDVLVIFCSFLFCFVLFYLRFLVLEVWILLICSLDKRQLAPIAGATSDVRQSTHIEWVGS